MSLADKAKTSWEIYLDVCHHMFNRELIPKDSQHQFVTLEEAQKREEELKTAFYDQVRQITDLEYKIKAATEILDKEIAAWEKAYSLEAEFLQQVATEDLKRIRMALK